MIQRMVYQVGSLYCLACHHNCLEWIAGQGLRDNQIAAGKLQLEKCCCLRRC